MADIPPLTDENIVFLEQTHKQNRHDQSICAVCGTRWPCTVRRAIARIAADAEQQRKEDMIVYNHVVKRAWMRSLLPTCGPDVFFLRQTRDGMMEGYQPKEADIPVDQWIPPQGGTGVVLP